MKASGTEVFIKSSLNLNNFYDGVINWGELIPILIILTTTGVIVIVTLITISKLRKYLEGLETEKKTGKSDEIETPEKSLIQEETETRWRLETRKRKELLTESDKEPEIESVNPGRLEIKETPESFKKPKKSSSRKDKANY